LVSSTTIFLTAILFLGVAAQWLAWRLRLPAILLLLAFGFGAGYLFRRMGQGPDELIGEVLFPAVSLAVGVILFEGGLTLRLRDLRETGGVVVRLVTLGVLVTWILSAAAAHWILGLSLSTAALLGAILTVSGPTVIMPLLRSLRPVGRVGPLVKWEGIVNDPIGAVLAVLVFEAILAQVAGPNAFEQALVRLGGTILAGAVVGTVGAYILLEPLRRFWIPDFLHSPVFLATVVACYVLANLWWQESGLIAVTLMGVILANQKRAKIKHVAEFKENLRTLLLSVLFIVLAARIRTDQLAEVGWRGIVFVLLLVLVIRPLVVLLSTLGSELKRNERMFLAWLHPRGIVAAAVSTLFALEIAERARGEYPPQLVAEARQLAPITFVVIVGTVTIYGLTARPVALWLGLSRPDPQGILFAGAAEWIREIAQTVQEEGFHVLLVDTSYANIAAARMQGLPTCYANVLSEYVHEDEGLADIGRLLAMTPNDEVNSLAMIAFADQFGRAGVFKLPAAKTVSGSARRTPAQEHQPGRILFAPDATYSHLARRFAEGAELRKTRLTEDFTYEDFRQRYGESALVLFRITDSGKLLITATEEDAKPQPGQKLIGLVEPVEEKA